MRTSHIKKTLNYKYLESLFYEALFCLTEPGSLRVYLLSERISKEILTPKYKTRKRILFWFIYFKVQMKKGLYDSMVAKEKKFRQK